MSERIPIDKERAVYWRIDMADRCLECGNGMPPHWVMRLSAALTELVPNPYAVRNPLIRLLVRGITAFERSFTPWFLTLLVRFKIATRLSAPDDKTELLAQMIWKEAKVRDIDVTEIRPFGCPVNVFLARLPQGRTFAYEGIPLGRLEEERASWMNNKAVLKERFRALGFPVAKGAAVSTLIEANALYDTLTPPLIAKPFSGSASRHTILHINDAETLTKAFMLAREVAPRVVIEEELVGPVYRATVVGGVFAAALRRDPPHVIGDGVRDIRALVMDANTHPARSGPYFHPIRLETEAEKELSWQGLSLESIPAKGRRVLLHQKVNWSVGGTTEDVTDRVHPDTVQLFEEAASALKAPLVGIDFIIEDITRPWREQTRLGILECNSMPFFDNHHLPFSGTPRNVAARIWDLTQSP